MRNMKDANKKAFKFLSDQLTDRLNLNIPEGVRYFYSDDSEKEWLKYLKIDQVFLPLPEVRCISITHLDQKYLALVNADISSSFLDPDVISPESLNSGIISALLSEELVHIDSKTEMLNFYNEVMFQHLDLAYNGHDFADILRHLQPINFFSFPESSVLYNQDIKRILSYIYSKNSNTLINKFNDSLLDTYSELALIGSNNISFGLVISSLLATSFKHSFLELYRLVERLFPISYLKDYHLTTKSELSFIDFSTQLENATGWRPKEDEALNKIFDSTERSTMMYFDVFFNSCPEFQSSKRSKFFYQLRNSIVHFRNAHNNIELNENQWNKLLHATLFLIDEHYSRHENVLKI